MDSVRAAAARDAARPAGRRKMKSNYQKFPETVIGGYEDQAFSERKIRDFFTVLSEREDHILVVECYPGVDEEVRRLILESYAPDTLIDSEDIFFDGEKLTEMMAPHITEDRVRGIMYYGRMEDFIDPFALIRIREQVPAAGRTCIFGVGAGLIHLGDTLIYCDLARWEIQLRKIGRAHV